MQFPESALAIGRSERWMTADQKIERMRIRAKLSDEDRDFLDAIRQTFPSARMVGIRFSDGETIGNIEENDSGE